MNAVPHTYDPLYVVPRAVYYRTARGGRVPLSRREQRNLLELYSDHARPVREIADLYGVSTATIYRWLPLLGVRPQ